MADAPKVRDSTKQAGNRGLGRKKGVPNKLTADVKGMILGALSKAGGERYLLQQSKDNPVAFMTLVGKVLPLTVAGDPSAPLVTKIVREIVDPAHPHG